MVKITDPKRESVEGCTLSLCNNRIIPFYSQKEQQDGVLIKGYKLIDRLGKSFSHRDRYFYHCVYENAGLLTINHLGKCMENITIVLPNPVYWSRIGTYARVLQFTNDKKVISCRILDNEVWDNKIFYLELIP